MAEASGYTSKQEITKINNDLNLIKNEVMNELTDNIPYIENCVMTTYVRNGKLIVEIIDGRTVDNEKRKATRRREHTIIIILHSNYYSMSFHSRDRVIIFWVFLLGSYPTPHIRILVVLWTPRQRLARLRDKVKYCLGALGFQLCYG